MASTDASGAVLPVTRSSLGGGLYLAAGRATFSSGTVEVATGLSRVEHFAATQIGTLTATEAVIIQVDEDFPVESGTLTVKGIAADVGGATVGGAAESFSWIAIGYR